MHFNIISDKYLREKIEKKNNKKFFFKWCRKYCKPYQKTMKSNKVKLTQKIYLIKFLKKNNIKARYYGNRNAYFDSLCPVNNLSKNSLAFLEKKYFLNFKINIERNNSSIIITDNKNDYKVFII